MVDDKRRDDKDEKNYLKLTTIKKSTRKQGRENKEEKVKQTRKTLKDF